MPDGALAHPACRNVGFCQISRHFRARIPDAGTIIGQKHNISYCRGTLARKLTEPPATARDRVDAGWRSGGPGDQSARAGGAVASTAVNGSTIMEAWTR